MNVKTNVCDRKVEDVLLSRFTKLTRPDLAPLSLHTFWNYKKLKNFQRNLIVLSFEQKHTFLPATNPFCAFAFMFMFILFLLKEGSLCCIGHLHHIFLQSKNFKVNVKTMESIIEWWSEMVRISWGCPNESTWHTASSWACDNISGTLCVWCWNIIVCIQVSTTWSISA